MNLFLHSKNVTDLNEAIKSDRDELDSWASGEKLFLDVPKIQEMLTCIANKHQSLEGIGENLCLKIK